MVTSLRVWKNTVKELVQEIKSEKHRVNGNAVYIIESVLKDWENDLNSLEKTLSHQSDLMDLMYECLRDIVFGWSSVWDESAKERYCNFCYNTAKTSEPLKHEDDCPIQRASNIVVSLTPPDDGRSMEDS